MSLVYNRLCRTLSPLNADQQHRVPRMPPLRLRALVLAVGALLATQACAVSAAEEAAAVAPATVIAPAAAVCTAPGANYMARVELLFATERNDGQPITDAEWLGFVSRDVTPRFPDGLTELSGRGQWRGPDGVIGASSSRILLIWYTPSAASEAAIEAIRTAYKQQFNQLSVMRVDGGDCVSF